VVAVEGPGSEPVAEVSSELHEVTVNAPTTAVTTEARRARRMDVFMAKRGILAR